MPRLFLAIMFLISLPLLALDEQGKKAYDYAVKASIAKMSKGLSANQKKSYQSYVKAMEYKRNENIQKDKLFDIYYLPIALEVEFLYESVLKHSEKMKEKADLYSQQNNFNLEDKAKTLSLAFKDMADAILKMTNAAKQRKTSTMNSAIKEYIAAEGRIIVLGVKAPPRNWLTADEARYIQYKLNNSKTGKTNEKR